MSETVVLDLDDELPAGEARLALRWTGRFTEGLRGLYLAGSGRRDPVRGRGRAARLPLLRRARLQVHLGAHLEVPPRARRPDQRRASLAEELEGPHRKVRFAETRGPPSYLVALVVGPLVSTRRRRRPASRSAPGRLEEKRALLGFGQEAALAVLPRLEDYFGLPYAFGKLDQVGIPDFEAGAMENAGLITYREVALLLDPATASLSVQKRVAEVVTHELAHQWFGNWVTMVLVGRPLAQRGLRHLDGLQDRRRLEAGLAGVARLRRRQGGRAAPRRAPLHPPHPRRGGERRARPPRASTLITYEKGGAVLRMIEGYLGEEPFRDGHPRLHAQARAGERGRRRSLGRARRGLARSRWSSWPTPGSARAAIRW